MDATEEDSLVYELGFRQVQAASFGATAAAPEAHLRLGAGNELEVASDVPQHLGASRLVGLHGGVVVDAHRGAGPGRVARVWWRTARTGAPLVVFAVLIVAALGPLRTHCDENGMKRRRDVQ